MKQFIQVGVMALRRPDGSIDPAMPIYQEVTRSNKEQLKDDIATSLNLLTSYFQKEEEKENG